MKRLQNIPGNFFGFLIGTNFAPMANAMGGPKMNPLASTPDFDGTEMIHEHHQRK
jgi:hypothetical protein